MPLIATTTVALRFRQIYSRVPYRYASSVALGVVLAGLWLSYTATEGYPIGPDAAVYLFSGLMTANGEVAYLHFFDVKPPGIHLISAVLHLLGLGRVGTYLLSVGLMWAVMMSISVTIAHLIYRTTNSDELAALGPLLLLLSEPFATGWMHGPMGKYFVVLCFLVAPLVVSRGRPLWGLLVATIPAAFWQFASPVTILFYILIVAEAPREQQARRAVRGLGVMGALAILVSMPFLLAGAGSQLAAQAVVIPVFANTTYHWSIYTALSALDNYRLGFPLFLTGILGTVVLSYRYRSESGTVGSTYMAALAWFLFGGLVFSQFGRLDQIVIVPFIGIGTPVLIDLLPAKSLTTIDEALPRFAIRRVAVVVVISVAAISIAYWLPYPPYRFAGHNLGELYLSGAIPEGCHGANNNLGKSWVEQFGETGERCRGLSDVLALLQE